MVTLQALSSRCDLGEEQGVLFGSRLGLGEGVGNVLNGSGLVALIHICLIHQELDVTVVHQSEGVVGLGELTAVPTAITAVALEARGCHAGEVEGPRIQETDIVGDEGSTQSVLTDDFQQLRLPSFCVVYNIRHSVFSSFLEYFT